MADQQIPIQPVENPILCSPYAEPDQHWLYDTRTGIPTRTPGRRPASYWFKSERTGSAQQQMSFLAEDERDDLPLVNALRDDVKRWRESGWEGALVERARAGGCAGDTHRLLASFPPPAHLARRILT